MHGGYESAGCSVSYPSWVRGEKSCSYFHDEWQRVPRTQRDLFEHLCLLVFQSGLWWSLILDKRQELNTALHSFDPVFLADMDDEAIDAYLTGEAGIRNREKLRACIHNARILLATDLHLPDLFRQYFPQDLIVSSIENLPRTTSPSDALAQHLKTAGVIRVGPVTTCSLAQAAGYIRLAHQAESK